MAEGKLNFKRGTETAHDFVNGRAFLSTVIHGYIGKANDIYALHDIGVINAATSEICI